MRKEKGDQRKEKDSQMRKCNVSERGWYLLQKDKKTKGRDSMREREREGGREEGEVMEQERGCSRKYVERTRARKRVREREGGEREYDNYQINCGGLLSSKFH